jgi:hypothetical protein
LELNQQRVKSVFTRVKTILIAGMGNVKQGNWTGTLVYFSFMILLGAALVIVEQKIIEPIYDVSNHQCILGILLYLSFTFFWNGTRLLGKEEKNHIFDQSDETKHQEKPT